jgi:carboxyl-terminal processing protease
MKRAAFFIILAGINAIYILACINVVCVPTQNNGSVKQHSALNGYWRSIGGGYILDATKEKIGLYSYTDCCCYQDENKYVTDLLNTSSVFIFNATQDTLSLYLHDLGKRTEQLQTKHVFSRLSALPDNCAPLSDQQKNDPIFLSRLMLETLKENYAFTSERNINWNEIEKSSRQQITASTTKEELHKIIGEAVKKTKDQHTKIILNGNTIQYSNVPTGSLVRASFEKQDSIKDFNTYANYFFSNNYKNITNKLLKGKGTKSANNTIEWGSVTDKIGYISIYSLTGFASPELSRKQHLDTLNFYMEQIMKALHDKKAIIIDISLNFGGYDAAGLTIAGYFTNKPVLASTIYQYSKGKFAEGSKMYIQPAEKHRFTGPVYLLTTDISRSAAETFAMSMKALPNVTIVGTNTLGILSNMLGKPIGDYYMTMSYEKYITPDGKMYEVTGIDPDKRIDVFTGANLFNGHSNAVHEIIRMIERDLKISKQ